MPGSSRPLTPAEKYYALLDAVSPMNLMMVADLDRALPADLVERRWAQFVAARVLPRLRITEDLRLVDGPPQAGFRATEVPSAQFDGVLAAESQGPFGLDRPMRCHYLVSPDEDRARVVLVVHHAVTDGRVLVGDLQLLLRSLEGADVPTQAELPAVPPPGRRFAWQDDRDAYRGLLRELAARNEAAGPPGPADWPRPEGARRPRFHTSVLEPPQAAAFLAAAKRQGARAYPALGAAWLTSVAGGLCAGDDGPVLQLATPVDLAPPNPDPSRLQGAVVGVVADRHRVTRDEPWELAQRIGKSVALAAERGDGELFFQLSRAASIRELETGVKVVAQALRAAPPAVSVTNLGVLDPGDDPEWVRSILGYLAPTPNQVLFVSGTGYRGRIVQSIGTDDGQLDPATAAAVVDGFGRTAASMSA